MTNLGLTLHPIKYELCFLFASSAGDFGGFLEGILSFSETIGFFLPGNHPCFDGKFDIPSGKRLQNELGRSTIFLQVYGQSARR